MSIFVATKLFGWCFIVAFVSLFFCALSRKFNASSKAVGQDRFAASLILAMACLSFVFFLHVVNERVATRQIVEWANASKDSAIDVNGVPGDDEAVLLVDRLLEITPDTPDHRGYGAEITLQMRSEHGEINISIRSKRSEQDKYLVSFLDKTTGMRLDVGLITLPDKTVRLLAAKIKRLQ